MNNIFRKLLYEEVLANDMNNFVMVAKTKKELKEQMIHFLKIAEKYNFCFKRSKCYNLKLELRLHLGKNLRKCKG